MISTPVYMDNQSTTQVDPAVAEVVVRYMREDFGNAGSITHPLGAAAREAVESSRASIAERIGAGADEIIFTSGATESNNLALLGLARHPRARGKHIVSVTTEHKAILDPLARLEKDGFDVTYLPVAPQGAKHAGQVDMNQLADALCDDTLLVTIMFANNEIGVIQPLAKIGRLCADRGIPLHSDATQAVGRIPTNVKDLNVDLMSFSAHKVYGPKGVGALYVRRLGKRMRLSPVMVGGGQERGLRSGTLNVPGICGFAKALEICASCMASASQHVESLREELFRRISEEIPDVVLNGPSFDPELRLTGNLNLCFRNVDGEALMMSMKDLAVSSGSACTAADPKPSHVLKALGLSDDAIRSSLRFGLGRFNTNEEVEFAANLLADAVQKLRALGA